MNNNEKIIKYVAILVSATLAISVITLILDIVLVNKSGSRDNSQLIGTTTVEPTTTTAGETIETTTLTTTTTTDDNIIISKKPGFKTAANLLLSNINEEIDPCEDFYSFSCDNYVKRQNEYGDTFEDTQYMIYDMITDSLNQILKGNKKNVSKTEQIAAHVFDVCLKDTKKQNDKAQGFKALFNELSITSLKHSSFSGFPALTPNWKNITLEKLWYAIGKLEIRGVPTILESYVSVSQINTDDAALYFYPIPLLMPRDFYVKPQFLSHLENYLSTLVEIVTQYAQSTQSKIDTDAILRACEDVVRLEIELTLARMPRDLLRNYVQQNNNYRLAELAKSYKNVAWTQYLKGLEIDSQLSSKNFVVTQPIYLSMVETILDNNLFDRATFVNLIIIRWLYSYSSFIGNGNAAITRLKFEESLPFHYDTNGPIRKKFPPIRFAMVNVTTSRDIVQQSRGCVGITLEYMPYAIGFVYVKNVENRYEVYDDITLQTDLVIESFGEMVESLEWITNDTLKAVKLKSSNLRKNIAWPFWYNFEDSTKLDKYHSLYFDLLDSNDWYNITVMATIAEQHTENFDRLNVPTDNRLFYGSPATVNAWYIPELNSITFPFGILNPPFYRYDFPQSFNYAGQGGTAGHELSHGFDDEGVQFGPHGELSHCTWNRCGWMDHNSTLGFLKMAQCVVSQYSEKCCPLKEGNIHCANGLTTQGENIADIAGEQAAYYAYQKYIKRYRDGVEEERLPGMEKYTPTQIFWISYGNTWCEKINTKSLTNQLLVDPHAPGSCRVNQVVQDIPEFGRDFGCKRGSPMYPNESERCKVWMG